MASQEPPRFYDDDILCALEDALRQVLAGSESPRPLSRLGIGPRSKKGLGCEADGSR
jgi:hypothetical protein